MDLVARAIEEAGVDEADASRGRRDAGHEIRARTPLLVHDAHFHRVLRQAYRLLDAPEDLVGEGDFLGPMHLRLDDIDRTGAAVV